MNPKPFSKSLIISIILVLAFVVIGTMLFAILNLSGEVVSIAQISGTTSINQTMTVIIGLPIVTTQSTPANISSPVVKKLTHIATDLSPTDTPLPAKTPALLVGSTQVSPKDGMVMVYVPAGEFLMGSNNGDADEKPQHTVSLDAYWIDQTEVTNGMYAKCEAARSCTSPEYISSYRRSSYYGDSQYNDYPVIYVYWNQANDYCGWTGRRLPTEAEWEKAARGTDGRTYPWGEQSPTCSLANFGNCEGDTTAVGSYPQGASVYGSLDMAGNVWEWVADWYSDTYYASSTYENPPGPGSGAYHGLRGGSWYGVEWGLRSSNRDGWLDPDNMFVVDGFRCVR